ncbi:hypothetical protein [Amycolatopsis thermoflava]|uniref:hypothetical protein n=1 Tax=Amycolatopsis thermoflava TaxID=84480 RepID=UPI003F4A3C4C
MMDLTGRHPSTVAIARFFEFEHLREPLRSVSKECHDLAEARIQSTPDSPELVAGLRKLLEAKDCFVRAAL